MATYKEGKLISQFVSPDFTKETGEVIEGKVKLQLLEIVTLRNGEVKNALIDISIPKEKLSLYKDKIGTTVKVEVNIIAKGNITYYGV